ncbi:MAG: hypothetical protein KDC95_15920 [Planctomycetes bacterium]|nr:hypothetical protein [Planctomycetota bacterium]
MTALCARLGIDCLPPSYESFLATHDGGWVGDRYVYGIPELELLFPPGYSRGADEAFLLPFHPVDRFGIECFAIPAAASSHEANVLWCRDDETVTLPHHDAIHPLAEAIVRGRRPELCEATYVDFTDWALDALDEARRGTGVAWCAGARDN